MYLSLNLLMQLVLQVQISRAPSQVGFPTYHKFLYFSHFELLFCFFDLSTQVLSEYFILDLSSVMTNIGGNVGLFLGYSLMTMLLGLIESIKLMRMKISYMNRQDPLVQSSTAVEK